MYSASFGHAAFQLLVPQREPAPAGGEQGQVDLLETLPVAVVAVFRVGVALAVGAHAGDVEQQVARPPLGLKPHLEEGVDLVLPPDPGQFVLSRVD